MESVRNFLCTFTLRRGVVYLIGLCFLACGITMNTKTQLGVSPVISVAYSIAVLLGISFSVMTFLYYVFLILVQRLMLRKGFEKIQWLQLLASLITSAMIGFFDRVLPTAESIPMRVFLLLLAIVLTGIGIILTVGADFVPNPADGTAHAISLWTGKSLGLSKNLLDLISIAVSLAIGLIFRGQILGVGAGTVVTMLLTGRVVALLQKPLLRLSGLS